MKRWKHKEKLDKIIWKNQNPNMFNILSSNTYMFCIILYTFNYSIWNLQCLMFIVYYFEFVTKQVTAWT
jgi:hypothetical protein